MSTCLLACVCDRSFPGRGVRTRRDADAPRTGPSYLWACMITVECRGLDVPAWGDHGAGSWGRDERTRSEEQRRVVG